VTVAFQPKGEIARWRVLYNVLKGYGVGDTISYSVLAEALDLDPDADRNTIQLAMRRAAQEYLRVDKRTTRAVPGVGYEITSVEGKMEVARLHQRKASRSLGRGHDQVIHVDFNGMDPEVRKGFEVMAGAFAAQLDYTRRLDVRQRGLEEAVRQVSQKTDANDAALSRLQQRLEALEAAANGDGGESEDDQG
jgi:hypothetical protein